MDGDIFEGQYVGDIMVLGGDDVGMPKPIKMEDLDEIVAELVGEFDNHRPITIKTEPNID